MNTQKTGLIAIMGTGIIIFLIVIFSNFNIEIKLNGNSSSVSANQPTSDSMHGSQGDSMTGHHGGSTTADSTIFNGLVGKPAPDFTLETYDGNKITLSNFKGQNVILFFNEGLMCYPACWNQIAAFGKNSELGKKSVILNIEVDPKSNWKPAIDKMPELAAATVLFDTGKQTSQMYGVLTLPSSMHKGQFPGHSYVIIGKDGIVKYIKDDLQMAVRNQELNIEIDKL